MSSHNCDEILSCEWGSIYREVKSFDVAVSVMSALFVNVLKGDGAACFNHDREIFGQAPDTDF